MYSILEVSSDFKASQNEEYESSEGQSSTNVDTFNTVWL